MQYTEHKARLTQMLADITDELKTVGVHDPHNPADWTAKTDADETDDADDNLTADHIEEWNERVALVADLETQYNNIVAALARIDAGTYGVCEISGAPIEPERLDADPTARTCIAHKDEQP
jgi:RNA polymerase-binding transcription factor DksA